MKISLRTIALTQLAFAINIATVGFVDAEEVAEQTKATELASVVVVGEITDTVVEPKTLEKYQANDLEDVFRHVPSVQVGGSLGIAQKLYIRGLEDSLINITVDGAPQTGTLFHHIGRVSIEPELLQTVEVQTGAGEATSGAGAIGGAIRFKTKSPDDLLKEGENFGGKLKAGYFSNEGHRTSTTLYGNLNDNWGLLGSYVAVDRDNMEDGDGDELYGTAAEQTLGFFKVNGQLSDKQTLSLSFEQRDEEGDFGARPNWPALETDPLFPMEGERQTIVLNHQLNQPPLLNLETALYHTTSEMVQDRYDRWGEYGAEIITSGIDIRNTSALGNHAITYGVDYREDTASSEYLAPDAVWQAWAWDPNIGKFKEKGEVSGVYIQDHWQLTNSLLLSYGVRYDDYELEQTTYNDETSSNGINPNIGFAYEFAQHWTFSAGYAEAMRGKEVSDAFTLEHQPGRLSLQPGLNPEEVKNREVGLEYNNGRLMTSASVYRMNIDDVIFDQIGGLGAPQDSVYYENIGELETDGFELMLGYQWDAVTLGASYSVNNSEINDIELEGYEHNGLGNSRGDTFELDLAYSLSDSLEMGWHYTHVQDLNNIEVLQRGVELGWIGSTQTIDKPGYDVHDIYLRWLPLGNDTLAVDLAVLNLLGEQYRDHSSVGDYNDIPGWGGVAGLYEAGRDIRLGVAYAF